MTRSRDGLGRIVAGNRAAIIAALVAASTIAGCEALEPPPYFPAAGGGRIGMPLDVGVTGVIGVAWLQARPGDELELVHAQPVDRTGTARVDAYAMELSADDGGVGAALFEAPMSGGPSVADRASPIDGFRLDLVESGQVLLAVSLDEPGCTAWDAFRVTFRVDGRVRTQTWTFGGLVWAAIPEPEVCEG